MTKNVKSQKIILLFLVAISVALQIQTSLFAKGDYLGLRVNLADCFLPFAGIFVLFSLLSKKSRWPQWLNTYATHAIFAMLGALTISLINGYLYTGEWSSWALINKYIGFIILICYFFLAGWIATNFGNDLVLLTFTRSFCATFITTLAISLIAVLLQPITNIHLWIGDFAWDGFMANRNAFMVAALFTMILLLCLPNDKKLLHFWWHAAFWTIIPTFAIYNASRTGWIFGIIILCVYLIKHPIKFLKEIAPFLLIGISLSYTIFSFISYGEVRENRQYKHLLTFTQQISNQKSLSYNGDQNRIIALEDGLDLYKQSNPIIGAGLGAYKAFQIKKRGEFINIIDWSTLWLLTETGILGLTSFSTFFLLCLNVFYEQGIKNKSPYHTSLFFFLILLIAISFLHELLYTRFFWFAIGIGMSDSNSSENKNNFTV